MKKRNKRRENGRNETKWEEVVKNNASKEKKKYKEKQRETKYRKNKIK